jgi:hypothetical protein
MAAHAFDRTSSLFGGLRDLGIARCRNSFVDQVHCSAYCNDDLDTRNDNQHNPVPLETQGTVGVACWVAQSDGEPHLHYSGAWLAYTPVHKYER